MPLSDTGTVRVEQLHGGVKTPEMLHEQQISPELSDHDDDDDDNDDDDG